MSVVGETLLSMTMVAVMVMVSTVVALANAADQWNTLGKSCEFISLGVGVIIVEDSGSAVGASGYVLETLVLVCWFAVGVGCV